MQPSKHLLILVIAAIIAGLLFLLWRWPQGKHLTFSQHAAQHRSAILFYIFFFTAVLPPLLLFMVQWFVPAVQPAPWFLYCITGAVLFQYSVTLVPEVGGWKTTYHVFGSAASGVLMLLALCVLLFSDTLGVFAKLITSGSIAAMLLLLYIGSVNRIKHPNLLILQSAYYIAFFVSILTITYTV